MGAAGGSGPTFQGPQPTFGETRSLADSPPPISGGTLLALSDRTHVVASDPDRDRIYVVDLGSKVVSTIQLSPRDEPGRLAEDADGQVHVVLRSAAAVATIRASDAVLMAKRPTCASPRGITYDEAGDRLLVACDTGELVSMRSDLVRGITPIGTFGTGLRDVVVVPGATGADVDRKIYVTRFRTAELLSLDATGKQLDLFQPRDVLTPQTPSASTSTEATLAWRMLPPAAPGQLPVMIHELASSGKVATTPGGYGNVGGGGGGPGAPAGCNTGGGIVSVAISSGNVVIAHAPQQLALPVDAVRTSSGGFAVVAAGNAHTPALPQVFMLEGNGCPPTPTDANLGHVSGEPIAIARLADDSLLVQSREPATLTNLTTGEVITLATESREDTGHAIFHSNSGIGLACASCHGEGGDDAHVWKFDVQGPRRTPSLRGTLQGTAPYHWDGAMKDVDMLADEVMTGRMAGPKLDATQKNALQGWLFALPPPAEATTNASAQVRGRLLFDDPTVGCATCHSGPRFTNSATVDIGTGGAFQVPSLVGVAARAPYLHDGCAKTLKDRFGICSTAGHGNTSSLSASQIDDLIAYLNTL
jgi:hypothetical protein